MAVTFKTREPRPLPRTVGVGTFPLEGGRTKLRVGFMANGLTYEDFTRLYPVGEVRTVNLFDRAVHAEILETDNPGTVAAEFSLVGVCRTTQLTQGLVHSNNPEDELTNDF